MCLSCHDGTIAIGMLDGMTEAIHFSGGITGMPPGATNLQTDLSNDHPISFAYDSALAAQRGELKDPLQLPSAVKLEDGQWLQCTSCHNPHKNPHGMFLVMANQNSALCLSCHDRTGWETSTHAADIRLTDRGCQNCHQPHGAPGARYLLQSATEEGTCLTSCHNGVGDGHNIKGAIEAFYNHPVADTTGIHDPNENMMTMEKHVECADCHNPHQVNHRDAPLSDPPMVDGRLTGVKGMSIDGAVLANAEYEYEICFGCHAERTFVGTGPVSRYLQEKNERLRFDPANPSFHPIAAPGKNLNVPSLRPEYTEASQIYCGDCHGSSSSVKAGGVGANGPHGSIYPHILLAEYAQDTYPTSYSVGKYALCFRCHDPNALFTPGLTTFSNGVNSSHRTHVIGHGTPCSACHDPHGVPLSQGATMTNNSHLINFNLNFVQPGGVYDSVGRSCTVSCHSGNNGFKAY